MTSPSIPRSAYPGAAASANVEAPAGAANSSGPYLEVLRDWEKTGANPSHARIARDRIYACFLNAQETLDLKGLDIPSPPDLRRCAALEEVSIDGRQARQWPAPLSVPRDCRTAVENGTDDVEDNETPSAGATTPRALAAARARILGEHAQSVEVAAQRAARVIRHPGTYVQPSGMPGVSAQQPAGKPLQAVAARTGNRMDDG
ncbi:MAG: hypothetical protein ACRYGK_18060, partial [Janthinobacterium lividum]